MKRMKSLALAAAGVIALSAMAASGVLAAVSPSASAIISARKANFRKMGAAAKVLKTELAGNADKAKMLAAAKTIAANGRLQGALFPAGTGPSAGVKTDALPVIWTDRATFDADMKKLIAESDKLVTVANSGDAAAIGAQFKVVGGTCAACHRQFHKEH
ncbi:cytochrome c [Novosphingobium sp.]|uniref:c-type cytochrome n=1 Tax=Novosphingobium sp. TaxID=1874826 RepID=UPI002B482366|nr:cytochrome c [Novosphingobium sp.]HKR92128.1 cytochrome c [Novosphingobium sp.]